MPKVIFLFTFFAGESHCLFTSEGTGIIIGSIVAALFGNGCLAACCKMYGPPPGAVWRMLRNKFCSKQNDVQRLEDTVEDSSENNSDDDNERGKDTVKD